MSPPATSRARLNFHNASSCQPSGLRSGTVVAAKVSRTWVSSTAGSTFTVIRPLSIAVASVGFLIVRITARRGTQQLAQRLWMILGIAVVDEIGRAHQFQSEIRGVEHVEFDVQFAGKQRQVVVEVD